MTFGSTIRLRSVISSSAWQTAQVHSQYIVHAVAVAAPGDIRCALSELRAVNAVRNLCHSIFVAEAALNLLGFDFIVREIDPLELFVTFDAVQVAMYAVRINLIIDINRVLATAFVFTSGLGVIMALLAFLVGLCKT